METEQRTVGSVHEGIDVQRRTTAIRNRKEEDGIDEETRKGKPPIRDRKEAEKEVERLMAEFLLARKKAVQKREEERRSWLCHLPEYRTVKEKVRKNQPTVKGKEDEVVGEAAELPLAIKETAPQDTKAAAMEGKEKAGKNQPTAKGKEDEVVGEAAEAPPAIKETPPQDTKAAAMEQFRATGRKRRSKSGPKNYNPDPMAVEAQSFRRHWNYVWAGRFGSYEDITRIPPMIYTDKKPATPLNPMETLQIFSVKIAETAPRLLWPLDVFGMVIARDVLDHNRNIIFHRTRDNCQTISTKNPYLELTGPSRAVVVLDPVHLEVMLQLKGSVQSKDKDLSSLVVQYVGSGGRVHKRVCPSKLSTVELTFGGILQSVEATISVQVVGGSWPDGFRGEFTANTTSLDDMKIQLLAFGDGKLPVAADGMVKLSRRVVSVEHKGELRVSVNAVGDQAVEKRDSKVFRAQKASRCKADVEVGSCKMKITVAWSLLSDFPDFGGGSSE